MHVRVLCSCSKDHVKVYNVASKRLYPGGPETLEDETLVGVYCGNKLPGPQMSEEDSNQMRVRLTTNDAGVEAGFRAKYEFVEKSPEKRNNSYTPLLQRGIRLGYCE